MRYAFCIVWGMITPDQIKKARQRLGESQATFAKRFGVDQSTLHRWETEGLPGRGPSQVAVEHVLNDISEKQRRSA